MPLLKRGEKILLVKFLEVKPLTFRLLKKNKTTSENINSFIHREEKKVKFFVLNLQDG